MLNNISWTNYLMIVSVLVVLYYFFIGIKFYSRELTMLFSRKGNLPPRDDHLENDTNTNESPYAVPTRSHEVLSPSHERFLPPENENDSMVEEVEELTIRIKQTIREAVTKNYFKDEFILSIKLLPREYKYLKGAPLMRDVINVIISECEKYGYVQLDAEEQGMLWKKECDGSYP